MANVDAALIPEMWSAKIQVPLYESLVAMLITNMELQADLQKGDTVHKPFYSTLAAQIYVKGTDVTIPDWTTTDETLVVDQFQVVPFYLDDVTVLQSLYAHDSNLTIDAAFRLRDIVDADVLGEFANAANTLDDGDLGGTPGDPIAASTTNIIEIFSRTRQTLREADVEEDEAWFMVVDPKRAELIERLSTTTGFQVSDSTLRNGYAGDFLGFRVYVSNNLTSSAGTTHLLAGKHGAIDVVMQQSPTVKIKDEPKKLGVNFLVWMAYGLKTFTQNSNRLVDVQVVD